MFFGLMSEKPLEDALLGPTLTCLIGRQMFNLKFADRFFFSNDQKNYNQGICLYVYIFILFSRFMADCSSFITVYILEMFKTQEG